MGNILSLFKVLNFNTSFGFQKLLASASSSDLDVCTDVGILQTFRIIDTIVTVIKVLIPIILIITGIFSIFNAIFSDDTKQIKNAISTLIIKFFIGVTIFFIPTIMNAIFAYVKYKPNTFNLADCLANSKNIDYYKKLQEAEKERQLKELQRKSEELAQKKIEREATIPQIIRSYDMFSTTEGSVLGKKYNLSDSEITFLAHVAKCEQGNINGAKAELSLFANRFELYGSKYSSVTSYVRDSGWFSCARHNYPSTIDSKYFSAAKEVLVLGNRTLPLYVIEHDCFNCSSACPNGNRGDICSVVTNGQTISSMSIITDRSKYIPNNTILNNKSGARYTFYSFPCDSCDPFGYTENSMKKYNELNKK